MAILTQLLILAVLCMVLYALFPELLSKLRRLFPVRPATRQGVGQYVEHTAGDFHDAPDPHGRTAPVPVQNSAPALSASVKVVVYVPDAHADAVREAIGQAGGGTIGNYTFCTFSSLGTGRYLPGPGANPMVGTIGVHERVEEERIEFTCDRPHLEKVVATIKKVHPYEEIVIDIYPLE